MKRVSEEEWEELKERARERHDELTAPGRAERRPSSDAAAGTKDERAVTEKSLRHIVKRRRSQ